MPVPQRSLARSGSDEVRRSVPTSVEALREVRDIVHELLATEVAIDKLARRVISADEAGQLPRNRHVIVRNPSERADPGKRRLLIGRTDGGRPLTLVIEQTVDPTTWLIVTGWSATAAERNLLSEQL